MKRSAKEVKLDEPPLKRIKSENEHNNSCNITDSIIDRIYNRLDKKEQNYNIDCEYASNDTKSIVLAINYLTEFLSIKILEIIMEYYQENINISDYILNGWETDNSILYDTPSILVSNVKPIMNQPSIIFTIGIPGSGKTTWAQNRVKLLNNNNSAIFSADLWYDLNNKGQFDSRKLQNAHEWCQMNIINQLNYGNTVVVNNTNTTSFEMHWYYMHILFTKLYDIYKIVFVIMPEMNVDTCKQRCLHTISVNKIERMKQNIIKWFSKNNGKPSVDTLIKPIIKYGPVRMGSNKLQFGILYIAVIFKKSDIKRMHDNFKKLTGLNALKKTTDCHLTILYKPTKDQMYNIPFNKKIRVKMVGYCVNKYIQCLICDILDDDILKYYHQNYVTQPHITISLDNDVVSPSCSNMALQINNICSLNNGISKDNRMISVDEWTFDGYIGAFNPKTRQYTFENPTKKRIKND